MEKLSLLRFDALAGYARTPWTLLFADERAWYSEAREKVLGTILQDHADKDYVCIVLGRDRVGRYRAVHLSEFFPRLRDARAAMPGILAEWGAKDPADATLMPYASLKEALAAKRHASSFCQSLNGMWKFNWVAHPAQGPVDFFKPEFNVRDWKEIPVPSCWQLLGYGTPYYRNIGYRSEEHTSELP